MKKPISLGDRIRHAKSETEVQALLKEGASYEYADPMTRRRWKRLAAQRVSALTNPAPTESAVTETAPKKGGSNKSKYVAKKKS